jgi:hypothetical protein
MDSQELLGRVRALRARGFAPQTIARALGVPPATDAPLLRAIAQADHEGDAEQTIVGCWVSPGWSEGLTVEAHPRWPDVDAADAGTSGLVSVLLAREQERGRVGVCGWLVDVYCLGGQRRRRPPRHGPPPRRRAHPLLLRRLPGPTACSAGGAGPSPGVRRGCVCAKPRLRPRRGLRGNRRASRAVGRSQRHRLWARRQALLRPGPHDNAPAILETLEGSVGRDNFHFLLVGA